MDDALATLMAEAIGLASLHRPHPNPRVGAIVLDPSGRIVARGAHEGPGLPHAERLALAAAGEAARGGVLVVTLEPCVHTGRTPPCTEAVIASGVRTVVVGALDPDDRVAGRGITALAAAGIEVRTGVASDEVEAMDPGYFHHRRTGRPRVVLKAALTLDGQVAAADGSSQWITGPEARADGHRLRAEVDAILVGAGTVIADNPRLTVRLAGLDAPQPRPVVIVGRRPLPAGAALWERNPLIVAPAPISVPSGSVIVADGGDGRVHLGAALEGIGAEGVLDLLVEGGPTLAGALWEAGLVDHAVWYVAARIAGGVGRAVFDRSFPTLSASRPVDILSVVRLGSDLRVEWAPRREREATGGDGSRPS